MEKKTIILGLLGVWFILAGIFSFIGLSNNGSDVASILIGTLFLPATLLYIVFGAFVGLFVSINSNNYVNAMGAAAFAASFVVIVVGTTLFGLFIYYLKKK